MQLTNATLGRDRCNSLEEIGKELLAQSIYATAGRRHTELDISMPSWLSAYPFATFSALATYALLLAMAIPLSRRAIATYLTHPIPPTQTYLLGFDTMRGLAALYVAAGHCWWFARPAFDSTPALFKFLYFAHKAVPIFAALSGFLIYRSVLQIGSIEGLREYAVRRFFRIYPVYAFAVLVGVAFGQYAIHTGTASVASFVVSDLFMLRAFWAPIFANPVTWSLYSETLFYMILPMAVITLGRERFRWFALIALIAFAVADFSGRDHAIWQYFLVGILASEAAGRFGRWAFALYILGNILLVLDLFGKFDWGTALRLRHDASNGMTIGLGVSTFLILATLPDLPKVGRALNVLPLRVLGVISYSLFLIHPFYIVANFPQVGVLVGPPQQPLAGVATMPAWYMPAIFLPGMLIWAVFCFVLIERPAMRFGRNLIRGRRRAASPMTV